MKKKYLVGAVLLLIFIMSFSVRAITPSSVSAEKSDDGVSAEKVLEARFLNMLNHNLAYDDDFNTVEVLVNRAATELNIKNDGSYGEFISAESVKGFVYGMYGVEIEDFSFVNTEFPQKDGFVYIVPCGYSVYSHSVEKITANPDGTYTVISSVTVKTHDSGSENGKAETLFVPNEKSAFGFNIVYSNISFESFSV